MKRKAIAPRSDGFPPTSRTDHGSYSRRMRTIRPGHTLEPATSLLRRSRLAARRQVEISEEEISTTLDASAVPSGLDGYLQRRNSYRLAVSLKTNVHWTKTRGSNEQVRAQGVVTNLSGGGALLFLRRLPDEDNMTVTFAAPYDFVEDRARRATGITRAGRRPRSDGFDAFLRSCEAIRRNMRDLEVRVVKIHEYSRDSRGPVYALSLAFEEPNEDLYRLVRYFEHQGLNREERVTETGEFATGAAVPATA